MDSALTSSDLSLVSLLSTVLRGGRTGLFPDCRVPLRLLCYFSHHVKLCRATQFATAGAVVEVVFQKYVNEDSLSPELRANLIDAISCTAYTRSLDSLLDFIQSLRSLLENEPGFQPNKVCAPTCITMESPLGVYLRTFLARWECMEFGAICALYESLENFSSSSSAATFNSRSNAFTMDPSVGEHANKSFLYDLGTEDGIINVLTAPSIFSGEQLPLERDPQFYLLNAQKAMASLDFHAAEDSIHKYYDSNSTLPGLANTANGGGGLVRGYGYGFGYGNGAGAVNGIGAVGGFGAAGTKGSPAAAIEALMGSVTETIFASARHQMTMLALATAWAQGGFLHLSRTAIEEAMKTAHQRGDHAAVARALLLLHVVAAAGEVGAGGWDSNASDAEVGDVSAEEVLARCLHRCATLQLRGLSAQAALLMVRHRSRLISSLKPVPDGFSDGRDAEKSSAPAGGRAGSSGSVQNLWSLWTCALLGDLQLTTRVYAERSLRLPLTPAAKDPNAGTNYPLTTEEADAAAGTAALVAVDLWSHLGLPDMAELQVRRALRQLSGQGTGPELVSLGCKLAYLHVDVAVAGQGTPTQLRRACVHSISLLDRVKALFPAANPQGDAIFATRLYCCTYAALADRQWEKALRLAMRLADAIGVSLPKLEGSNNSDRMPLSVEQIKAGILVRKVTEIFDAQ